MFWGIVLEPGVKYKTNIEKSTRIANAALAYKSPDDKASVKVQYAGMEFILCHLDGKNNRNTVIDVAFDKDEEIVLVADGSASVHLTGLADDEDGDDSVEFDSDEEEAAIMPVLKKRKGSDTSPNESPANAKRSRKADLNKSTTEDDDEDEDDSDFEFGDDSDEDDDELGEDEEDLESFDEDMEMDEDEDDEEEEQPTPLEKKGKKGAQVKPVEKIKHEKKPSVSPADQKKPVEAAVNGAAQEGKKKKKKKNKKNKENKEEAGDAQSPAKGTPGKENVQKTENKKGVNITTLKAGTGPVAKTGKTVHVYYRGRLKSNNKEFDKVVDGKGFAFRLGNGEVIKGWDIGVEGMKVGEKRRLVVPPNQAYGPKGVKPDIPPNATLVFDVELKAMS